MHLSDEPSVSIEPIPHREQEATDARRKGSLTPLSAYGEPVVWLAGGMLAVCLAMTAGLFALIVFQGFRTFWPVPVARVETTQGAVYLGEVVRSEPFRPEPLEPAEPADESERPGRNGSRRRLIRTGNFEITGTHFHWVNDGEIVREDRPEWALVFERLAWGRFYGTPYAFHEGEEVKATDPAAVWSLLRQHLPEVIQRRNQIEKLERQETGRVNRILEEGRLALRTIELREGRESPAYESEQKRQEEREAWASREFTRLRGQADQLREENSRWQVIVQTSAGEAHALALADLVRVVPANRLSVWGKWKVYGSRWVEFLTGEPREANSEGGIYPAIFGTVAMTLIMSFLVAPFGVMAALYLREYAKDGPMVSAIRVAVNNLAGVPSIVYGVFGLGFFCYTIGGSLDAWLFEARLPNPTYGTGGLLWASLTLALLTLPVVIVATEEALAAVPGSMREGSYACGASQWQTIRRIVLPRALPGILTGMILAMARGAGEVAPLMLTGAVKLAPSLPVDGVFPYVHPERSFMHLGFHIYDLGFQSQNSEAAKPMVFTATLILILIILALNLAAMGLRPWLRRRFGGSPF